MDENFILELAAHMRDFGYWADTLLFFHDKIYADSDRSFFDAEYEELNRTLIEKKTLPTRSCASYQFFSQEMTENVAYDDDEIDDFFDDFYVRRASDLEWYSHFEGKERYGTPHNFAYICTLSEDDKKDFGSLLGKGILVLCYERMGGIFYTDCNEPGLERLAPYARKFMRANWQKYRGWNYRIADNRVALIALEKFLEKYNLKVTEESCDVECSTLLCIHPREAENGSEL